jgi:PKD repeat protein
MKIRTLALTALVALACSQVSAQTNTISTLAVGTASTGGGLANGVVTLTPRIGTAGNQPGSVLNNLAGLQYVAGQIPLNGSPASVAFFALYGGAIPGGVANPAVDFTSYGTLISPTQVTTYSDLASKLTSNTYSGLTFAAADLGFGASNFYMIHHAPNNVDYFAAIVPATGVATSIADLKPMSWPATGGAAGGPASAGSNGYFALASATGILSAGAPYADNSMYYLRTDSSSNTQFGVMIPALTGASQDTLNLTTAVGSFGVGGYTTLAFTPSVVGNIPASQFYYLRLDPLTGNTVLGRINPSLVAGTRIISDIANLGGVFNTLNFAADATGPAGAWGSSQFYVTGAVAPGAQSVSFEAIPNHNVGDVFTVTPTASSGLDIDVTVVSGPATVAETGVSGANPSLRVFTVTTTGPGLVTLQARQAGQIAAPAFTANMLRQTFDVLGLPTITSTTSAPGTVGAAFTYTIASTGSPTSFTASPLPSGLVLNAATGVITGTPTGSGPTVVTLTSTNASGTSNPVTLTITVAPAGSVPVVTSATSAPGTVGSAFAYSIAATGSPSSYAATGLPSGLAVNTATGAISGTPTASGPTVVSLTATNATGTSSPVSLTITVAAAGAAPVITSATNAPGTVGTVFVTYMVAATGSPTSYTATGLPAGLVLNALTGAITGTPTVAGATNVPLTATNSNGTSAPVTLTITVAAAGAAPIVISPPNAPGTVGTVDTYPIVATGLPTSYTATGLPPGLTLNPLTGTISGTPTTPGTYVVTITATNSGGTSAPVTLTIVVAPSGSAPVITNVASGYVPGAVGSVFSTYTIAATGSPTSYTATNLPPGLTLNSLTGAISGTPTAAGTYTVTVTAANGSGSGTLALGFAIASVAATSPTGGPVITSPASATGSTGSPFSGLTIAGTGSPTGFTATGLPPGLTINGSTGAISGTPTTWGTYTVAITATNSGGTTTSTVDITILMSRIMNFSARAISGPGADSLIVGFVVDGDGKNLLVRGIGPTLASFGIANFLNNPILTLNNSSGAVIATDTGWSINSSGVNDSALIASTAASVGAFPLGAGSSDSAVLVTVNNGAMTSGLETSANSTGVGLVEIYDTGGNPASKLVNVSARMEVTGGDGVLIGGLVIGGNAPKVVLIRGDGPSLTQFGVPGVLGDPQITIYSGTTVIASNAGWSSNAATAAQISAVGASVGAFPLVNGSKDSALLINLQPGAYTVQVTSVSGATGVALIEVYDTQ